MIESNISSKKDQEKRETPKPNDEKILFEEYT